MTPRLKQLLARGPELIHEERVFLKDYPIAELGITLVYVFLGAVWVVFTDELFDAIKVEKASYAALEAVRGLNFIVVTGFVLYLVLRRNFHRRRLAEEAARLSKERFEAVAHATTDAIWDWNLETNVLWWSEGVQKLFGYRPEEVSNRIDWWLDRMHPEDKDRVVDTVRRISESGGQSWTGHYRVRRADGSYATVLDRGYILRDPTNRPVRLVGGVSDITERRKAEEALENSRRQLRALSARLQSSREKERAQVSREIHDDLGQQLTAIKMNLDWLERRLGEKEGDPSVNPMLDRAVECSEQIDNAITSVQRIATDLRPGLLDSLDLGAALRQETERFQQRSGLVCKLSLPEEPPQLSRDASTAVFRVLQEALTNVARHAKAANVSVSFEASREQALLTVEDDGIGIPASAIGHSKSIGLIGMTERASILGGDVSITPISPRGTRVLLRLPAAADDTQFWADL